MGRLSKSVGAYITLIILCCFVFGCEHQDEKAYKIGFSQCVSDDQWRQQMHEEMKRELSFYPELILEIKDAKGNNELQVSQINEFIEEGIDLLIVSPNEAVPITPVVESAFNQGIPVIVIDRKTSSSLYTAYVGADNYEVGKTAGNYVKELVKPGDKILEIWGLKGSTPAVNRNEGFQSALDTNAISVVPVYSDWTKATAKATFREALKKHADADIVFAHNDMMALGAYEVARDLGITKNMKFIGVDGLSGPMGGIQLVIDGVLNATFLYPTGGEDAIRIARDILTHKSYQKENILQTTAIDATNVRIMKLQTDKILSQQGSIERQQNRINEQIRIYRNQRTALYLLVGSLTISIVLGAYALYTLRERKEAYQKLNSQNNQIRQQKEQIEAMAAKAEEATQAKFKFFTNISHEFRTPLTLILGPLEELIKSKNWNKDETVRKDLLMIKKNTYRLLRLVKQLMDFRKIENNKFQLRVAKNDIAAFIEEIKKAFDKIAEERKIDYRFVNESNVAEAWFDGNILDKILFNLLSNAFKFTPDKGFIHISLKRSKDRVSLAVKDNGRGMSGEHLNHLFDRFYQGEYENQEGTGLGLALAKELISLHKGEIKVESGKNTGTCFTIEIPTGEDIYSEEERSHEISENTGKIDYVPYFIEDFVDVKLPEEKISDEKKKMVLVIEDNKDLVGFLTDNLSKDYRVTYATNGIDGITKAIDEVPDIIICDVMIPEKDGLAVTQNLKSDFRTSHIPVIMLTAKSDEEQILEGIQSGADLYITKPFSFNHLYESIKTLLKNREMMKAHYAGVEREYKEDKSAEVDIDKKFISRFKAIVDDHLGDPQFGVNELCEQLGFSRVQLYRKVKALLGCTINDYINEGRLIKAGKLLAGTDMNISEVAYETGFSSPTYFSTAFKNYYNISPSEFKADKRKLI